MRTQIRIHGCLFLCALLLLAGCSRKPTEGVRPALGEAHQRVVGSNNELAFKLYDQLRRKEGNLVLSPYGASSALAMLLAGADGRTRDELLAVLGESAKHEPELHQAHGELLRWLVVNGDNPRSHQLDLGSALFTQAGEDYLKSFVKTLETHYQAEPYPVDFISQPATARKVINDWAAEKTHDKIRKVISPDEIDEQTRVVLANAVYFKGTWLHAFKPSRTGKEPFHISADQSVDVDIMHQTGEFGFAHQDDVRVLVLPYRGEELSMALVLPDNSDGLAQLEEQLDSKMLSRWIAAAAENVVSLPVWIPKFTFGNRHDLKPALKELGVTAVFDSAAADLSRIDGVRPSGASPGGRLFVDRFWQQALLEVNEEGTEAAAVTVIDKKESKAPDLPYFRADHPFLFLIRENETGLILFLGRMADPTKR